MVIMSTCLAELPGSLIARSNGTGHDPAVPTWVLHSPKVCWNCRLVQNDQFAAIDLLAPFSVACAFWGLAPCHLTWRLGR